MTQYVSEADLLAETAEDGAEDFTLSSGKTVRVRSLTRAEHLWIGKGTEDPVEIEARMVSKALVLPVLTVEKVKGWQKTGRSSVISEISDRIRDLSGFGEGARKSRGPATPDES